MTESINVTHSFVEEMNDLSQWCQQARAIGENNPHPQKKEKSQPATDLQTADKPTIRYTKEGQRENLLYKEELGFVPMRQDPRYVFYRQDKSKKFDLKNEDVLHCLEKINLLQNLELLQVLWSNKSVEIRSDSEQVAQDFLTYDITIRETKVVFRYNAFRRLRVSIYEVHLNVSEAALEYEM